MKITKISQSNTIFTSNNFKKSGHSHTHSLKENCDECQFSNKAKNMQLHAKKTALAMLLSLMTASGAAMGAKMTANAAETSRMEAPDTPPADATPYREHRDYVTYNKEAKEKEEAQTQKDEDEVLINDKSALEEFDKTIDEFHDFAAKATAAGVALFALASGVGTIIELKTEKNDKLEYEDLTSDNYDNKKD